MKTMVGGLGSGRGKLGRMAKLATAAIALMCVALMLFILLFVRSYARLRRSIEQERKDYANEISAQMLSNQRFMKEQYAATVQNYAAMLAGDSFMSMAEARSRFRSMDGNLLLLVSRSGKMCDMDGNAIFMADHKLIMSLHDKVSSAQMFASLNNANDYWLFIAGMDDITIENTSYGMLVLAVPAEEYRNSLSVSLFDQRGASYIVRQDGSILVQPDNVNIAFTGYNLYAGMQRAGASAEDVEALQHELTASVSGSRLISTDSEQWLISYHRMEGQEELIVVAVPLTVTAASTYRGMTGTILYALMSALALTMIAIILVLFFSLRERERSREVMAMAAKSDFFSKMGHDIRTPLNAIIGMQLLAREHLSEPELAESYLKKSATASDYLLSIINDMLDMSRIESGKMRIIASVFDLDQLLSEVCGIIEPAADNKRILFRYDAGAGFNTLYLGDPLRIKQILMNLLSNAVKFTDEGGAVTLRARRRAETEARDAIELRISDTGIGMSEEYLQHIFTPFEQERSSYTQQYAGSGLGLSIVHSLVELMDGSIDVESRVGEGSVFTVRFSLAHGQAETAPASAQPTIPEGSFTGRRVLLVEDNDINLELAAAILASRFGIVSDAASNGRQAVEVFEASPEDTYDLILMDVKMPVMDGLEATRRIRALRRADAARVPIVALSANAFDEDIALSFEVGMNDYLAKPIDIGALTVILAKYMKKQEEEQP